VNDRNGYMLQGRLGRRGYDWWWHSLVAFDRETGEPQPFFISYFVINPALGGPAPVLGQLPENRRHGIRPSYTMLKAGTWHAGGSVQTHNFFGIDMFAAAADRLRVQIGPHVLTDTRLQGEVALTPTEAEAHPEYMSDAGQMSWDLAAEKVLGYSVGYGASPLFRALNAFEMYWHVGGMLTRYAGVIRYNGRLFDVHPDTSAGYQDKNWGQDYTRLWIWLNCNRLVSRATGRQPDATSLVVGGAEPVLWGRALPRRLLVAFYYEGRLYEFNFSKFWTRPRQRASCRSDGDTLTWSLDAWNRRARIAIRFASPKTHMQLFRYENPDGQLRHRRLWNGGWASGTVELYERRGTQERLVDVFDGTLGGCEYGEAGPS
jgi:hypothetical protein